jgi:DNA-binding MarR family transcriptional regulator
VRRLWPVERRVLFAIMKEPLSVPEVAEKARVAPTSVTPIISELRKRGIKIMTVGSTKSYKYEYGGKCGSQAA